jgi:YD repeat-containing protein
VQASEDPTTHRPISVTSYDNLSEATQVQQYDGDGVTVSIGADGSTVVLSTARLRGQTQTSYDDQRRVYQTQTYSVDPVSGTVSTNFLTSNTYYNHRGQVIETAPPGGPVTKTQYDGAGRLSVTYTTDGASGITWAAAGSVASDNVLEQSENQYDKAGNVIESIQRQRFDNETTMAVESSRCCRSAATCCSRTSLRGEQRGRIGSVENPLLQL